jgi:hypothetical protein
MTAHLALRRAFSSFTSGSEAPAREIIGRTSQRREPARGCGFAVYAEPIAARDPDAEAGRGRLGHGY